MHQCHHKPEQVDSARLLAIRNFPHEFSSDRSFPCHEVLFPHSYLHGLFHLFVRMSCSRMPGGSQNPYLGSAQLAPDNGNKPSCQLPCWEKDSLDRKSVV